MRSCDLCENSGYEVICREDRHRSPLVTVACSQCGLVGHEQIPTESELEEFYTHRYREEYHGEQTPSDRRIIRAWNKGQRVLKQLQPLIPQHASLFEVGAGIGCNVKAFELAGYQASGIEPGTSFQKFSAEKLHAKIEHCGLFDLPPSTRHDVVLLIHVIEHFRSPQAALQRIHQIIRPGGWLYLECPSLDVGYVRRGEMFHFAHIHTFSPFAMTQMLARTGFRTEVSFSTGHGGNFALLLKRVDPVEQPISAEGLQDTLSLLARNHQAFRHLSGSYLGRRWNRLKMYASEFLSGHQRVKALLDRCQQHQASSQSTQAVRRAA